MSVRTNAGFLDSVPIGSGMDWFAERAPDNWMLCNGQAISREDYKQLYQIIGTTYGIGDGATTFNLPNFNGRVGVGKSEIGNFTELGTQLGAEKINLTENQLPPHNHKYSKITAVIKNEFDRTYNDEGVAAFTTKDDTTGTSGNGDDISIIQPSLVINKIIKVK